MSRQVNARPATKPIFFTIPPATILGKFKVAALGLGACRARPPTMVGLFVRDVRHGLRRVPRAFQLQRPTGTE